MCALGLEIDSELLAFLVEMTALEAERWRGFGDAMAVPRQLLQHDVALERGDAIRERARSGFS